MVKFRKHVAKRLKWVGLVATIALGLAGCLSYHLRGGYGLWHAMPTGAAPISQTVDDERFTDVGQQALEAIRVHRKRRGFPALTAAVSIGGDILWTGAVGWADLNNRSPATRATVMRIGSTSKAVTATALARLVDSGAMSLDAPLSEYADEWPNVAWLDLTPRQLISHTAGLPGYEDNDDLMGSLMTLSGRRHYSSVPESLAIFDDANLGYEPGTDFAYSSFGVNLIGAAIAASQQEPFLAVLDRLVFVPLGLVASGRDSDGKDRSELARFYQADSDRVRTWRSFDLSQRWPGGGLVSTSAELVRIGGSWMDPKFISVETRRVMWTPQVLSNGEVNEQSYAVLRKNQSEGKGV
jgi:CubicO group peptidase (beta-lactamase class C family)